MTPGGPPMERVQAKAAWVVAFAAIGFSTIAFFEPAAALMLLGVLTIVAVTVLLGLAAHGLIERIRPTSGSVFEQRRYTSDPTAVPPNLQSLVSMASIDERAELPGTIRQRIRDATRIRLRCHHALDVRDPDDQAAIDRLLSPLMRDAVAHGPDAPRLRAHVLPQLLDELESL
jgi:hypothetical protein